MIRYVIKVTSRSNQTSYFVGPSIKIAYNATLFSGCIELAKQYDSKGHAVSTAVKLSAEYRALILGTEVIEVDVVVKPTGGYVVKKDHALKNDEDQSQYCVRYPDPQVTNENVCTEEQVDGPVHGE